ncbi:hypothetical protein AAH979_04760 [Plantactinospora sp. ZYX-F-223]|uniref:3-dehydroquinate synthase family protein n=1 Tax=Plantactinospora sp. ZYX-F-223 TaxID=3144103 RepID=UPI0031FE1313
MNERRGGSTVQVADVRFGERGTSYLYGVDCVDQIVEAVARLAGGAESVVFVVDRQVLAHAEPVLAGLGRRMAVHRFVLDAAERRKRLSVVEAILEYAVDRGADRRSLMVAMGGGLTGNIAGLAAALLFRGIRLVHLPTTPVAAFDSVLSQKQAVNLSAGKNLGGTYLPPSLIGCDLTWLTSIPRGDLLTGVAEMAKNVLAMVPHEEPTFLRAVAGLEHRPVDSFVALCRLGIEAKLPMLVRDPRERGEAVIFEYGHTVGHALEIVTDGDFSHGEAIAWGMLVAAEASAMLGYLDRGEVDRHHRLLARLRLPPPAGRLGPVDRTVLRTVLRGDNKRGYLACDAGDIPMVLLAAPGVPVTQASGQPLSAVPEKIVLAAYDRVADGRGRSDG